MIPEFIFNIKPSPWGKALGESFNPISKASKGAARYGGNVGGEFIAGRYGALNANGQVTTTGVNGLIARAGQAMQYFTKK